jgi:rubrerythrin
MPTTNQPTATAPSTAPEPPAGAHPRPAAPTDAGATPGATRDAPRTSEAWWRATKADPGALAAWLYDQYRGETSAAERLLLLRDAFARPGTRPYAVLTVIARQEREHAAWVGGLLRARGLPDVVRPEAERYWPRVLPGITDLATGAAVGAHAEKMRLERIEAIADDPDAPADVRAVFARILPQERFHERAFRRLAGPAAMRACEGSHELGRRALGLAP